MHNRRLLLPTTRAYGRSSPATQPPVTQTGDIPHGYPAAPFRSPTTASPVPALLQYQAPAHDAPVTTSSSVAQSIGGMAVQHPPVVRSALHFQKSTQKRVHGDYHGSTDPSAQGSAYQESHRHVPRNVTTDDDYNSLEKGVRKNSHGKGVERKSIKPLHAAQTSSEQRFTPAPNNPSIQPNQLPTQGKGQSGKMNHPHYPQHPQQPQYMQHPQQSAPADEDFAMRTRWLQLS